MAKAQRVLSIEIGYSLTQVCEMDFQSKHPQIYGVFSMKTPEGILDDGYIRVTDEYVNDLKSYITANGMTAKKLIFAVSSTKIANREALIPFVKEKMVRDMLMANITDYFPVDPSQYEFAHNIMDTVTDDAGNKQYRIMVMAAPADMLGGYHNLANALGLELAAIDYSGNSIFQALRTRFATGVNLTVKIDERSSLLTVTNNGVITMQRPGIYGADQVVDIMMETDVYGEPLTYEGAVKTLRRNNLVMRPEEEELLAEKEEEVRQLEQAQQRAMVLANTTGDTSQVASTTVAAKQAGANLKMLRLRRDVTVSYQQLIGSIVRVIDYYNSKNRDAAIDNIIITGIAADFWGFSGLLSQELGREVEVLKDLAGTNINQGLHLQGVSLGDYISVIGAGLGSVGFKPAVEKTDKKKGGGSAKDSLANIGKNDKLPYIVLGIGAGIAVILTAASVIPYFMTKTENQNLQEKKAQLAPVQDTYNEYVQVQGDYDYIMTLYKATENTEDEFPQMLNEIESLLPSASMATTLSVTTNEFVLTINTEDKDEVAKAIVGLRECEYFSEVNVSQVTESIDQETGEHTVTYTVTCVFGDNPWIASDEETEENAEDAQNADSEVAE
jgi:type IV pilus assembly protein PilM